ncbi:MAG: endo-1,4-beta-xylanase [Cyanobacteriota bacterium]|nr:endo-1,4-beta-xylanase [Cyanobacteriota bacterium]
MPLKDLIPSLKIGTAVQPRLLLVHPDYRRIASSEFNLLIPENEMKCRWVCQQPGTYNFTPADTIVEFAQQHNQAVRGHVLCWHMGFAPWMKRLTTLELEKVLKDYIFATVDRYKGKCYAWDVVSEAIDDKARPRTSIWSAIEGYIPKCFEWARQADPDAQLFYLDYRLHTVARWNAIAKMVGELKENGIPIDGVGLQLHHDLFGVLGITNFRLSSVVQQLKRLGVAVHISEVSIPIYSPTQQLPDAAKYELQANAYGKLMRECLKLGCDSFSVWGFSDACVYHKPPQRDKNSTPCLFDEEFQPKPAYWAVERELAGGVEGAGGAGGAGEAGGAEGAGGAGGAGEAGGASV